MAEFSAETGAARSPYEVVLGDRMDALHPRLRTYFSAIPEGAEGRGAGVFEVVGTPRRWLWPVWTALGATGIAFPGWFRRVPFSGRNGPDGAGRTPAVRAIRTFAFPGGRRRMADRISVDPASGLLLDELGRTGLVAATFDTRVEDGALRLASRRVAVRVGPLRVAVPTVLAPRVGLLERFDDERGRQHVDVTIDVPLLGRVYEYSGYFDYGIASVKGREGRTPFAAD